MEYCGFCLRQKYVCRAAEKKYKYKSKPILYWDFSSLTLYDFFYKQSCVLWRNCWWIILLLVECCWRRCFAWVTCHIHSDLILRVHFDNVWRRDALLLRIIAFVKSQNESGCIFLFIWIHSGFFLNATLLLSFFYYLNKLVLFSLTLPSIDQNYIQCESNFIQIYTGYLQR